MQQCRAVQCSEEYSEEYSEECSEGYNKGSVECSEECNAGERAVSIQQHLTQSLCTSRTTPLFQCVQLSSSHPLSLSLSLSFIHLLTHSLTHSLTIFCHDAGSYCL